jgi:mannosylglycoprotein endo-beta-mannosidase
MLTEVHDAICTLPKGKAPRHDGVPMEFFHECAQEVTPDLFNAITAMFKMGETLAFINKSLITFIPKSSNHAMLSNWRPITLLGSTYKILAKMLAGRVQAALPQIVRPN